MKIDKLNSRVTLKIKYKNGLLEKIEKFLNKLEVYGFFEQLLIKNKLTNYDALYKVINVNEFSSDLLDLISIKHEDYLELRFDLKKVNIDEFITKIKKAGFN